MSGLLNLSEKDLLKIRNDIFLKVGQFELDKKGFKRSPFATACFGKDDYGNYSYDYCRVSRSQLEFLSVNIIRGDSWIKFILNVFTLLPEPSSIDVLKGLDGLKFELPPNSTTKMRLRSDDYKGIPLFHLFDPKHKLGKISSEIGKDKEIRKLEQLIQKDLANIDSFVNRWHEMHKPFVTTWGGGKV